MTRPERDCLRALTASAAVFVDDSSVELTGRRAWSSALFVGTRLSIAIVAGDDERLDQWLAMLPDAEIPIAGYFIASAEVVARSAHAATLEVLMVES